jgi:hypothetical protein
MPTLGEYDALFATIRAPGSDRALALDHMLGHAEWMAAELGAELLDYPPLVTHDDDALCVAFVCWREAVPA